MSVVLHRDCDSSGLQRQRTLFIQSACDHTERLDLRPAAFLLGFGTLPILGSPARTSAQAKSTLFSKSSASTGSTCHPLSPTPNTVIERRFGSSCRSETGCSFVVAILTPSSRSFLSRR